MGELMCFDVHALGTNARVAVRVEMRVEVLVHVRVGVLAASVRVEI